MKGLLIFVILFVVVTFTQIDDPELMELKINAIHLSGASWDYCCQYVLGLNPGLTHPHDCTNKMYNQKDEEGKVKLRQCKLFDEKYVSSKNTE